MNLSINLAGRIITIIFLGEADRAVPLFRQFFRDFLHPEARGDARITVRIPKGGNGGLPDGLDRRNRVIEQRVDNRDVAAWLKKVPDCNEDLPLSNETVTCSCLGGLLLFNPGDSSGIIYLLREGPKRFMPLLRLFWIYFAQVLGESEGCFVHSAALVRDQKGYMFLGDSGAGKSTLANGGGESTVFSDDSPVLSKGNGGYLVFPSPYHQIDPEKGLGREAAGMSARVEGIYFLSKDRRVFREEVSRKEAVFMIIKRHILFFSYLSRKAKVDLFDLVLGACEKIPVYNLHFCPDQDIWGAVIDG